MSFSRKILLWYYKYKRDLPWRGTKDAYKIWLSEIILQQTRVVQGVPYYYRFIEKFPSIFDLAEASEEEVLKMWQGLGYYSRARNLHATAKIIAQDYGGIFPKTYKELLRLKGVGDYTASAIASICFDEPRPVVDGNVFRVLARYFGVDLAINSTEGIKYFKQLATEIMAVDDIRDYNQGIMEFGAIQCVPKNPDCMHCPLNDGCKAFQEQRVAILPVKKGKTKVRKRFFNYLVPISPNGKTILRQRRDKGIWRHLWEFPLFESGSVIDTQKVEIHAADIVSVKGNINVRKYNDGPIVHKLSHQHLYTTFWIMEISDEFDDGIDFVEIEKYPVPVLIADFLNTFKNSYF
ncbi:A/G-specific adenine glycosylase [Maribacter algicola]|uniref:A/G-specific adenine glycosylase n=1 Tax=Meishania litoralis TaxID=3434685 RepID=A0ACC7LJD5_9FLAO